MSTNIRKQLEPMRKRLRDRINEVTTKLTDGEDITVLKSLRSKLNANIQFHEQAYSKLSQLINFSEQEQTIVDKGIETSTELSLDTYEAHQTLIEYIEDVDHETYTKKRNFDYEREILKLEELKLEYNCKRAELETLKDAEEASGETVCNRKMQLPQMLLPTFPGKSRIHSNKRVSKIDKFKYFMSALEVDAKSTLPGFELIESHYDEVMAQLKDRYDDTEYIIYQHYKLLWKIPRCCDVSEEVRETFNLLELQIRSLQRLGEVVDNNYMISLVKSKFTQSFNLRLEESRDTTWTLQLLRKSITKLILAREKWEESVNNEVNSKYGILSKNAKVKCCFCEKSQWSDQCQQFKSGKYGKDQIKGMCFICSSTKHLYLNRLSKKTCFYCKEKRKMEDLLGDEPMSLGEEQEINLNQDVIMKTANVLIQNPKTGKSKYVTALMDSGSKRTYLTKETADIIQVERGPSNVTRLNTFSSKTTSSMVTSETNLHIEQKDGSRRFIHANVCKTITGNMIRQKLDVERYKSVWKHLVMADDIPNKRITVKIDLLIGNDYYDDIIKSEKISLGNGLYLINSTLGWMFSGRVTRFDDVDDVDSHKLVEEKDIARKAWDRETIDVYHTTGENEKGKFTEKLNSLI